MFEKINYEFEEISESLDFEYQDELVAVITAAIAASLKRSSTHSLVVRSKAYSYSVTGLEPCCQAKFNYFLVINIQYFIRRKIQCVNF